MFIHGLFRGAWSFDEALMPALSSAGYNCYALSLRGQGASRLGAGIARVAAARGGVPLAVNVADIAAFVGSLPGPPPVLVGHSLGGTFVQEYLALLAHQRAAGRAGVDSCGDGESGDSAGAGAGVAMPPLPPLAGAAALASACSGTVMAFGDFVRDVGVREFLFQMYIVASGAHLKERGVARYCWWGDRLPDDDAEVYHAACRASSRALPYITAEISGWAPAPPPEALAARGAGAGADADAEGKTGAPAATVEEAEGGEACGSPLLPPILAIGGEEDRIIRPFQVRASALRHGGARWAARGSRV